MASKKKQAAREAATAPQTVFPPKFAFHVHFPMVFGYVAFWISIAMYVVGDISVRKLVAGLVVISLPFTVFLRTYLFPANQDLFTRKQKQRLLLNREFLIPMPLFIFAWDYMTGRWKPTAQGFRFFFALNAIAALYFIYNGYLMMQKEKEKTAAKDPLGLYS